MARRRRPLPFPRRLLKGGGPDCSKRSIIGFSPDLELTGLMDGPIDKRFLSGTDSTIPVPLVRNFSAP